MEAWPFPRAAPREFAEEINHQGGIRSILLSGSDCDWGNRARRSRKLFS